jgi:hypothetical protein
MIIDTFIREYIQLPTGRIITRLIPTRLYAHGLRIGFSPNELNPGLTVDRPSAESGSSSKKSNPESSPVAYKRKYQTGVATTVLSDKNISVITWKTSNICGSGI